MKEKVLICGSTGFIGRNIAETLAKSGEYELFGTYHHSKPLTDHRIHMIKADLSRKEDVDKAIVGKDIIIQAAATTSGAKDIINKPYYHVTDNTVMNALIFRAAFDHKAKHVVFFSCTTMYQSSKKPLKETDFDLNDELYPSYFGGAWMKIYNEKMCDFYSRISDTKYTVIRHSNIYGPHDKYDLERSHVFGATVTKVMIAPRGGTITVWGKGNEERDLLYISDLVDLVRLAITKQKTRFELINAGLGRSVSIKKLVALVIKASGKRVAVQHDLTKRSLDTKLCLNTAKAKKLFGWQPRVTLENGIAKTIAWYKKHVTNKR